MSKTIANFTYPKDAHFQCTRCTLCCGDTDARVRHILVLKKEAEKVSRKVSKPVEAFANRVEGHAPYKYEMKKNEDCKCIFLENNTCTIYTSRPLICRYYPFQLEPQENGKYLFSFTSECPGTAAGKPLRKTYFAVLFRLARERFG